MGFGMRKNNFELPVTTLVGSRYSNVIKVSGKRTVDKAYRCKYFLTLAAARLLGSLSVLEAKAYRDKMKRLSFSDAPVFIIGFWRSGTTLMHHLLTLNPDFGFLNTYHSVFPNHVLTNQWWLKSIARLLLPDTRPGDNMKLDFSFPQEEEVALGNLQPLSFYNFFYFPRDLNVFVKDSLFFEGISEAQLSGWKEAYKVLINTALINTGGKRFVSKNPPNTFRIKILLEMFPDARFIYMHRNTYETLSSFFRFMHGVLRGVKLQDYDKATHELDLIRLYKLMRETYADDNHLIPGNRLVEVKYEDFIKHKKEELVRIYEQLELPGLENNLLRVDPYLRKNDNFKKSERGIDNDLIRLIDSELGDLVEL